eukprot:TRINITY_DN67974_c0_g2_i1.p1 TRINITY_DN67974_c0_g2~~TRINITY_DN67974_c0_g2_i1.p1  ORF type:complete len:280 (+),score=10.34 TRINITY_DN67974_c0_g2_i1:73-912(+)
MDIKHNEKINKAKAYVRYACGASTVGYVSIFPIHRVVVYKQDMSLLSPTTWRKASCILLRQQGVCGFLGHKGRFTGPEGLGWIGNTSLLFLINDQIRQLLTTPPAYSQFVSGGLAYTIPQLWRYPAKEACQVTALPLWHPVRLRTLYTGFTLRTLPGAIQNSLRFGLFGLWTNTCHPFTHHTDGVTAASFWSLLASATLAELCATSAATLLDLTAQQHTTDLAKPGGGQFGGRWSRCFLHVLKTERITRWTVPTAPITLLSFPLALTLFERAKWRHHHS